MKDITTWAFKERELLCIERFWARLAEMTLKPTKAPFRRLPPYMTCRHARERLKHEGSGTHVFRAVALSYTDSA